MKKATIGIDIGGTNTVLGIVDMKGNVLTKNSMLTPKHGEIDLFITDLSVVINKMVESVRHSTVEIEITGIGIGAPNGNYYTGNIEYAPNLSFKGVIHFVEKMKTHYPDLKIKLTNDANASAIGEMMYGGAKGMKNFVIFTLGTGVGSGIIVNGNLVYGHEGFAGECGHTVLIPGGRLCGCGVLGHLEAYCSATGMKRTAFELLSYYNASESLLAKISYNELDAKIIYEAALKGDRIALDVFKKTGEWLGQGLANTVHHLSPEAIFLFGGPTVAADLIFNPAKESMEKHLLPFFKNKIKILPSQLKHGDAAIVGASALVFMEQD
ncbi:MAG: ROK family protein [Bacteroidales bacterium]|jgi:glucokinase|nr:ROK family protein [Bacteroidales bacterium]